MTEAIEISAVVLTALAALAILPRGRRWIWPDRPDSDPRLTWIAALIVALTGALTTHLLAIKREHDRERSAQLERAAHSAQLRPLLRHDAEQFDLAIQELSRHGHILPIGADHPDAVIHDDMFSGRTLASDFPAHFPAYSTERDTVEKLVIDHEAAVRSLRDRVADVVKWQPDPDRQRQDVAYALVRQCMESAGAYELQIVPGGGYRWSDGMNGGGSTSTGEPPADLLARVKAIREFHPDGQFTAECDALKRQANSDLPAKLRTLISQATELSKGETLSGDCKYLH